MPKIIPEILKSLREQLGLSQDDLAHKANVSKRQIQRIETGSDDGKSTGTRGNTIKKIAAALGQPIQVLTGEIKLPSSAPEPPKQFSDLMREAFGAGSNLNYDLLEARYGVSAEEVVQVAPLLFALYAEKARKLHAPAAVSPRAEVDLDGAMASWRDAVSGDAVSAIRKENVFGDADAGTYWNPFVELLDRELAEANDAPAGSILKLEFGSKFRWHALLPGNRVPYVEVCPLDLDRLTCLNPDARFALKMGIVRLGEIPAEFLAAHRGIERVNWIIAKANERQNSGASEENSN